MKTRVRLALALTIGSLAFLAGCGDDNGSANPPGPTPAPTSAPTPGNETDTVTVPSNSAAPTDAASAAWAAFEPKITVQGFTISSPPMVNFTVTDAAGRGIVGLGNTSQSSTATLPGLANLAFAVAKLVPGTSGSPSKWVSYMVTSVPTTTAAAAPSRPTSDTTGTLADHGDGTYTYTFYRDITQIKAQVDGMTVSGNNNKADLGDLTYEPSLVHRLTIQLAGNAPGTGSNTPTAVTNVPGVPLQHPVDFIYDFKPDTGPVASSGRDMVTTANCNTCHQVLGGIPGDSPEASGAGFHGGSRNEVRYCVVCHTEQRKYGRTEATRDASLTFTSTTYRFYDRAIGNLPNEIHHIHGGGVLAYKNYNYAEVEFNEVEYPQDIRNCNKCHDATNPTTPDAKNWMKVPSRLACGGCHDGIDFATGHGVTLADAAKGLTETTLYHGFAHGGFQQPDDSECASCHGPERVDVDTAHLPVTPPNPGNSLLMGGTNNNTNAAWIASNPARLPAGAIVVDYDIKSVSVNEQRRPVMVFRMLQDGERKDLNDFTTATVNPATGQKEIWDDFMGAPSLYFVFAVPQDGLTTPADFNATVSGYLRTIWNGSATGSGAGTVTGPDADGYYTGTLTGVTIPTNAVMLTGGLGYSYNVTSTLPLTQTNLAKYPVTAPTSSVACATSATNVCKAGGLIVIAPNVNKVATGFTGRRAIVEDQRCNACHQELGAFTEDAFHAGQRNDGTTCAWCHTPNRTSSGWSADSVYFIHAIHGGAKRSTEFTWHASSPTSSFAEVKYPGILNFCEGCHIPGAYNFENSASADALPNRQYRTFATGSFAGAEGNTFTSYSYSSGGCTAAQSSPASATTVHALAPYFEPTADGTDSPNYGVAFSFNAGMSGSNACTPGGTPYTIAAGQSTAEVAEADAAYQTNLVVSPITTVCFACHDTPTAIAHFETNGGSVYEPRSVALNTTESCIVCHGPGRIADIKEVHSR